jgi:L,D-transpeptidase catalytic domain
MTRFAKLRRKRVSFHLARRAVVSLSVLIAAENLAEAGSSRTERSIESVDSRAAGEPIMAIVSLHSQRITIYDADGWTLRAPVSSGQPGRETPAGIFSIIQKDAEHHSNLYDDAYMPHMQRLTWSGIALHGGQLPGHPASHGCLRLPFDFAAHLFDLTKLGMRVIVAPSDVAPAFIEHPALFQPKPEVREAATARVAEAEEAAKKANQARLAALAAWREVAQATIPLRRIQNLKLREEERLADAEQAITTADSTEAKGLAEEAKARATAKVAELEAQLAAAQAELQPKRNAVVATRADAAAAEAAHLAAVEAARNVERALEPVSVFISRDTQRLYVRQAFQPILDIPVAIRDPELPIGTHVFTAVERADKRGMRWSAVSLVGGSSNVGTHGQTHKGPDEQAEETTLSNAKAALDRIIIPVETVDRIREMVSPQSSLIISDEGPSSETGRGTEFVIIMSGEPQGGLTNRRHRPEIRVWYETRGNRYWRSPTSGFYSTW